MSEMALRFFLDGSNMAISRTTFQGILDSFAVINLKTLTRGFLGLAMTENEKLLRMKK